MSSMDKVAKELYSAISKKDERTPKPYDTEATVVREEGDTIWVKIPGGIDETPVRKTINAKPGDNVQVRVADGRAWVMGNSTNPPTDDSTANYAVDLSTNVKKDVTVLNTVVTENIEATNARFGNVEADTAKIHTLEADEIHAGITYTNELIAEDVTTENLTAASGYIKDLTADNITANDISAASGYIKDLTADHITAGDIIADHATIDTLDTHYAQIDIANVNNAWIENGAIKKAEVFDENVFDLSGNRATLSRLDASKINVANLRADNLVVRRINGQPVVGGYTLIDSNSPGYSSKNPQALGWYEFVNADWVLSTDTTVDMTKAYYQEGNEVSLYDQAYIDGLENDLQQQIDGAVETFTGSVVPTLTNWPYTDWYNTSVTPIHDERAKHVGDIYYVVNSAADENGYCYRFAYDNATHAYSWVLIKDSDVTKALSDISELQTFESETTSWIDETDQGLETIRTNHTNLVGVVNKTVKESVQLWFTKANTTTPNKPTAEVTSTSTAGNAWRKVVPAYNASYPHYYYCWQYKFVDGTFGWSDVIRDIAMGETQGTARDAKNTADAALPAQTFEVFESTTFTDLVDEVDEQSTTMTNMTTRLGLNADGTQSATDIVSKESALEQTVDGISTRVGKTEAHLIGMYATCSTAAGTTAKVATITPAIPSGTNWELSTGTTITVKFTNANTTASPTLNVNSKGAKPIKTYANANLTEAEYKWKAGSTFTFTYNGTNWLMQDSTASVRMSSAETSITQNTEQIALRAKSSDVYTKGQVYTRTETDSAITTKAGEISLSVAQSEISKIEVGGRNLVVRATSTAGWIDPSGAITANDNYYTTDYIPVKFGDQYTFSVWPDNNAWFCGLYFDSNKASPQRFAGRSESGTVEYYSDVFTIPENAAYVRVSAHISTKLKYEKGNKATDWTPAPEDTEAYADGAVSTAKAEIKLTTDGISTEVSKVSSIKHYSSSNTNGWTLAQIKSWSEEGHSDTWTLATDNTNIRIGDTIYLKAKDTTRVCNVYIKITVTAKSDNNKITGISHGYEDILPVETIKSTINQSSDSVKIKANHVEIDGTAIFNAISGDVNDAIGDAVDAKKSVWTLNTSYLYSYANILRYSEEGYQGTWTIDIATTPIVDVKAGDTVRLKVEISDMGSVGNRPSAYVIGTVVTKGADSLDVHSHGLDTTVIDGGNILTNSIGANQIQANSIGAKHLTISDSTNLATANEMYESSLPTSLSTEFQPVISEGYLVKKSATQRYLMVTEYTPNNFKQNDELYFEFYGKAATAGRVLLYVYGYTGTPPTHTYSHGNYTAIDLTTTEARYTGVIKLANANWNTVTQYLIGFNDERDTKSQIYIRKLIVRRKNGGELIVDGSITTDKLHANAVTAAKLDATSINTSKQLTVGAMTDDAAETILNRNIVIGGRNLFINGKMSRSTYITNYGGLAGSTRNVTSAFIPVNGGDSVILQNWENDASRSDWWAIAFYTAATADSGTSNSSFISGSYHSAYFANGYKMVSYEAPSNAKFVRVSRQFTDLDIGSTWNNGDNGNSVKVEIGTNPTDFTLAPEDTKKIHNLSSTYSIPYATARAWAAEGQDAGSWTVNSTSGVDIGDTVRIKCTLSDMNDAVVYIQGTVTNVTSTTTLRMISHGLDTTVIDGGMILTGTVAANRIDAANLSIGGSQLTGTVPMARLTSEAQKAIQDQGIKILNTSYSDTYSNLIAWSIKASDTYAINTSETPITNIGAGNTVALRCWDSTHQKYVYILAYVYEVASSTQIKVNPKGFYDPDISSYITKIGNDGIKISDGINTTNYTQIDSNGTHIYKGGSERAVFGETVRLKSASGFPQICVDANEAWFAYSANDYATLNSNGFNIVKNGTSVAFYGDSARIGKDASPHVSIDANGFHIWKATQSTASNEVASFTASTIELGKNSISSVVKLCGGTGKIHAFTNSSNQQHVNISSTGANSTLSLWAGNGGASMDFFDQGILRFDTRGSNSNWISGIYMDSTSADPTIELTCQYVQLQGDADSDTGSLWYMGVPPAGSRAYDAIWHKSSNDNYGLYRPSSSSRRYKEDIKPVEDDRLDPHRLYDIPVMQFKFKEGYFLQDDPYELDRKDVIGFIAEDVLEHYPQAAIMIDEEVENWDERYIIPPMLKLIQEQNDRITELERRLS